MSHGWKHSEALEVPVGTTIEWPQCPDLRWALCASPGLTWKLIALLAVCLKIRVSWGKHSHFYSRKKPSCYSNWALVPGALSAQLPCPH